LRLLADEINPPEMPHATRLDRRRLGKASVYIHPHDPHPAPPLVRSRSRRDNTTTTDPRSQRNRVGRRGGQLLTRARSPSYWATCPPSVLRVSPVPVGRDYDSGQAAVDGSPHTTYRLPTRSSACTRSSSQDADRAALRRDRRDAVLGAARVRSDPNEEDRRLALPRHAGDRSARCARRLTR
jgi:hypothetical protein